MKKILSQKTKSQKITLLTLKIQNENNTKTRLFIL